MPDFIHHSETGSTNQDLLDSFSSSSPNSPHLKSILADHQTKGRGRLGRVWHDDQRPGGDVVPAMLGSIPQTWAASHSALPLLPFAVGCAVLEVCRSSLPNTAWSRIGLGWPNDVLVDGHRKLAGILIETQPLTKPTLAVAIGVGLNILPVIGGDREVTARAISLTELQTAGDLTSIAAATPSNTDLFTALIHAVANHTASLRSDPTGLMNLYREECVTIDRLVQVHRSAGLLEGTATAIADSGALIVTDEQGASHAVSVGDVVLRN